MDCILKKTHHKSMISVLEPSLHSVKIEKSLIPQLIEFIHGWRLIYCMIQLIVYVILAYAIIWFLYWHVCIVSSRK